MVVLILALTDACVLASMAALAMERRRDVGLMKASAVRCHVLCGFSLPRPARSDSWAVSPAMFWGLRSRNGLGGALQRGDRCAARSLPLVVALMVGCRSRGSFAIAFAGPRAPGGNLAGRVNASAGPSRAFDETVRQRPRPRWRHLRSRGGRVDRHHGTFRLRQDYPYQYPRRPGPSQFGHREWWPARKSAIYAKTN